MVLHEEFGSILRGARAGSDWAWRAIYDELAPVVLGYLRKQRAPSPEDLTGEVFLQVVRDLHRFDGDADGFRSWVFTIAHHRLIDARRKQQRHRVEPQPTADIDTHLPHDDHVERTALTHVAGEEALELLEVLTGDQREVLLLRLVGGLSVRETAEAMEKTEGAVKALQRRALSALERELARAAYPSGPDARSQA